MWVVPSYSLGPRGHGRGRRVAAEGWCPAGTIPLKLWAKLILLLTVVFCQSGEKAQAGPTQEIGRAWEEWSPRYPEVADSRSPVQAAHYLQEHKAEFLRAAGSA